MKRIAVRSTVLVQVTHESIVECADEEAAHEMVKPIEQRLRSQVRQALRNCPEIVLKDIQVNDITSELIIL